jgi:hypothetical protein
MRRGIRSVLARFDVIAVLMLGTAASLSAQRPTGEALLEGTVRDSATGRGVVRARVCARLPSRPNVLWSVCAPVDTVSAAYRLDSLPSGRSQVSVACETGRIFGAHTLGRDSLTVSGAAPTRRDWVVDTSECDPRPLRQVEGVFRGYYTPGFEASDFVPCAADAWFLPSDSLKTEPYDERDAWVRLRPGSLPEKFDWPRAPKDDFGNPTYYVQWRGTVIGPGRYGHMGVSPFELRVDSVLTLRAPRRDDCRPVR